MARREMTMDRFNEIKRLLMLKIPIRKISESTRCSRKTVREIRDGVRLAPDKKTAIGPAWANGIRWEDVMGHVVSGHPLKYIWREFGREMISYVSFWRQFQARYPEYSQETVVHRIFEAGERCEVDYAGDKIEWINTKGGKVSKASVFVGVLGFSQLIFAYAREDERSPNFLDCHNKMFEYFGGVPGIVVPDCLKQGVTKTDLYDPDINHAYMDLATHYGIAVVPARVRKPKDKSLAEGAVRVVIGRFKWKYRDYTFGSVAQINRALKEVCDEINDEIHTRFKVSRREMWVKYERDKLNPLPAVPFEIIEWKEARLHPDSHIFMEGNYYSAPHIYRGKTLKVKLSPTQVEIFYELGRIAIHGRLKGNNGKYITNMEHMPENAKAYYEATPQNLLNQAERLSPDLHCVVKDLFQKNAMAHIRRVQGMVREAGKEINAVGHSLAMAHIKEACSLMIQYNKVRVPYFKDILRHIKLEEQNRKDDGIKRGPDNGMLRYTASTTLQ